MGSGAIVISEWNPRIVLVRATTWTTDGSASNIRWAVKSTAGCREPASRSSGTPLPTRSAPRWNLSYLPQSGSVLASLGAEVAGYDTSKGALRFAVDTPLPRSLVEKLVAARLEEIDRGSQR